LVGLFDGDMDLAEFCSTSFGETKSLKKKLLTFKKKQCAES